MIETAGQIRYRRLKSGGYQLLDDWWVHTGIVDWAARIPRYIDHAQDGLCVIRAGYQWDGASGPVIDRRANMRAGLAHDAGYQLMRAGRHPYCLRPHWDALCRDLYVQDGGWRFVGALDYWGLRLFAGYAARRQPEVEARALAAP